jgi:hypothetical protein
LSYEEFDYNTGATEDPAVKSKRTWNNLGIKDGDQISLASASSLSSSESRY